MIIRLGYACISKTINLTTSTPYTYTNYLKEKDMEKLKKTINSNLNNLNELINYNIKNNIHFFRLSSKIIPLATKSDVIFDYYNDYKKLYNIIGNKINKNNMRIDFHPDQFCVLNSTRQEVVNSSIDILNYHYNLLKYLNIKNKVLVLHIGSNVLGKENSKKRFINNFKKLKDEIKECIAIENDDKIFNIKDCMDIYEQIKTPIILDYHHHICNNDDINIDDYMKKILTSWKKTTPKMHFSSPKNKTKKEFRSHNDYIDVDDFINFLKILKKYETNVDIMIEAKAKDEAVFRLIRQLKYKTDYKFIDDTSFII